MYCWLPGQVPAQYSTCQGAESDVGAGSAVTVSSILKGSPESLAIRFLNPNHLKMWFLLEICRVKRDCSYLPVGTFHDSAPKKFSSKGNKSRRGQEVGLGKMGGPVDR